MTHDLAYERLPDLLVDRDDPDLLGHVGNCHRCQRQLFLLSRVDRLLRQRRRHAKRRKRSLAALAGGAVAAAAIAALVVLPQRQSSAAAWLVFRTDGGSIVARARVGDADAENEPLAFVAKGLPTRLSDTYLLWTEGPADGRPVLVGRFMVSHTGACRARFNLPGIHRSARFWVTPSTRPSVVVAAT